MSTIYTTYLMLGIKTTREESGIDIWDDKWLPYIEGHRDVDIFIHYSSDEPNLYIGKVLASWSINNNSNELDIPLWAFEKEHQDFIYFFYKFIEDYIPLLKDKYVSLLFFTTAN